MPIKGIGIVNKAPPDALLQITSLGMASHQTNNQTNNQANKQTNKLAKTMQNISRLRTKPCQET